jgi:anthranilate synthase/aminodeoxychorismate synthase-like glutamine amidotransferase
VDELLAREPDRVVVSPGPCTPDQAGISIDAMRRFPEAGIPALGVCLGHQSLAQAFGGRVVQHEPVHGKTTTITHDGRTIFAGLDAEVTVGRYHSLVVEEASLPGCFEASAHGGGVLMGIRHRELPAEGVQFHPESVLTDAGKRLLANFLGAQPDPH